ncbi:hypothetical protein [Pararhodobacter oceanensis]|uniref:DUF455 domain-containing protein n=1 Tax=Pararhodobacter oceanensis TaxID=2172121 RepID=A0A2T8HSM2_9RHOB|nr:hypothetical protein [Pararhodobacter oceanensis]PVH28448.1 hypothetical protein DDE20_12825 [Pararhodobacter oceanensis]
MVDVRQVRGGDGLTGIREEVDAMLDAVVENTRQATVSFFDKYAENPDPKILAAWLEPRAWREIDYVFLLNEQIRRYGMQFSRKHITLLAKQSFQEAEHYEDVGRVIESLGGTVPTSVPESAKPWSDFLWECLDRHPLAAIAAWNLSETSASGSFEPTFEAGEKFGFDTVVKVYKKIAIDEKFHVGLGTQILADYAKTDHDREEILRAMRGMRDIAWKTFTPESVAESMAAQ